MNSILPPAAPRPHRSTIVRAAALFLLLVGGCDRASNTTGPNTTGPTGGPTTPAPLTIHVTGRQWDWLFEYPDGRTSNELHLPPYGPATLVVTSADVMHSLSIARLMDTNADAIKGRQTTARLREVRAPGEYLAQCREFCGAGYPTHQARVIVHEKGGYEKWLNSAPPATAPSR